jgi:2,5-diketo-D-gluconate reductase A
MTPRTATVPDDASMPMLGLGTWQIKGDDAYCVTRHALDAGYRLVDTATLYGNEEPIGRAIADSGIDRDQLFITTKYAQYSPGGEAEALAASLRRLGLDYVDLWLMHFPLKNASDNAAVWEAFRTAAEDGRARHVGVSNHNLDQLDALITATGRTPAFNQIRFNPALYDPAILAAHQDRHIIAQGHSPLRRPSLDHPTLTAIAYRHTATPAQVVLAWHLAHHVAVIPKSTDPQRIIENLHAFELGLDAADITAIDELGKH